MRGNDYTRNVPDAQGGSINSSPSNKYLLSAYCELSILPTARDSMVSRTSLEKETDIN